MTEDMKEDLETSRIQLEEMKQETETLVSELTKSREECKMMYVNFDPNGQALWQ